MKKGLLLTNIGSPQSADVASVRRYLRTFLTDKRVIVLPSLLRYALVYGLIAPFRAKQSAHAYQSIWTINGSPLTVYSQALKNKLESSLGDSYQVAIGMRYGSPSIQEAVTTLRACDELIILPLYPQYSSAASGSSIEEALKSLLDSDLFPAIKLIRDFYDHPAFIKAQAELIKPSLDGYDHVLFSYHGLPERHLAAVGCTQVCENSCSTRSINTGCYRAQCYQTSQLLAESLQLSNFSTAFQSRLGRTPWIKPYTDEVLTVLAKQGVKRLAVACPSFVTDCLETLEEIGIRARQQWQTLGGSEFTLIPCLNDQASWVKAIKTICSL